MPAVECRGGRGRDWRVGWTARATGWAQAATGWARAASGWARAASGGSARGRPGGAAAAVGAGVVALVLMLAASPAFAAPPGGHRGGGGGGGGGTPTAPTGNDISYPQCGTTFPPSDAFGIVGLTGGLANNLNPCFGPSSKYPSYTQTELYWAVTVPSGVTAQPRASLYVNTADPGNMYDGTPIADWPTSGSSPYGTCTTTTVTARHRSYTVGADSQACAWVYGFDKATQDVSWLASAATAIDGQLGASTVSGSPSGYPWWLDVETGNTWQSGSSGLAMNVADLQGMADALGTSAASTEVGIYSTTSQWLQITGGTSSTTADLGGLPDWIPGATTLSGAEANCALASFTGGTVEITQFSGNPDNDYSC